MISYIRKTRELIIQNEYHIIEDKVKKYKMAKTLTIEGCCHSIDYQTFEDFNELESVYIGSNIGEINYATFQNCTNLKAIVLNCNLKAIHSFAFHNCTNLKTIILPSSLIDIGQGAFMNCTSLESINLPKHLAYIKEDAFRGCKSLSSITLDNNHVTIYPDAFTNVNKNAFSVYDNACYIGNSTNKYICCIKPINKSIKTLTLHKQCNIIAPAAFQNCKKLVKVELNDELHTIGIKAFCGCSSLEKVLNFNKVTSLMERAFLSCKKLEFLDVSNPKLKLGGSTIDRCCLALKITDNYIIHFDRTHTKTSVYSVDSFPWELEKLRRIFSLDPINDLKHIESAISHLEITENKAICSYYIWLKNKDLKVSSVRQKKLFNYIMHYKLYNLLKEVVANNFFSDKTYESIIETLQNQGDIDYLSILLSKKNNDSNSLLL